MIVLLLSNKRRHVLLLDRVSTFTTKVWVWAVLTPVNPETEISLVLVLSAGYAGSASSPAWMFNGTFLKTAVAEENLVRSLGIERERDITELLVPTALQETQM